MIQMANLMNPIVTKTTQTPALEHLGVNRREAPNLRDQGKKSPGIKKTNETRERGKRRILLTVLETECTSISENLDGM